MKGLEAQFYQVMDWLVETSFHSAFLVGATLVASVLFGRRLNPMLGYLLWLPLVARLAIPALPQFETSAFGLLGYLPPTESVLEGFADESKGGVVILAIGTVWMLGVLFFATRLVVGQARLNREIARAAPLENRKVLAMLESCKETMSISRPVRLVVSSAFSSPAVSGFWRHTLVLPRRSYREYSDQELRFVFLHELAHLRGKDLPMVFLARLVNVIHWFNPLVWFSVSRFVADCEKACDARVLQRLRETRERGDYGRTILKLSSPAFSGYSPSMALYIFGGANGIKSRIQSITRFHQTVGKWRHVSYALIFGLSAMALAQPKSGCLSATACREVLSYPACHDEKPATGAACAVAEAVPCSS